MCVAACRAAHERPEGDSTAPAAEQGDLRGNSDEGHALMFKTLWHCSLLASAVPVSCAAAASGHPLNRDGGDRDRRSGGGAGPIRTERRRDHNRDRAPREPFARDDRAVGRSDGAWSRGPVAVPLELAGRETKLVGDTVRLSNLNPDISEDDLRYIFDKIGPIRGVTIHYNAAGKCLGTAEIQFGTHAAAELAVENLDQAEVDGRIMYVQIVGQMIVQASLPQVRRYERSPPRQHERRQERDRSPRRGDDRRGGAGDRQRGNGAGQRQGGRDGGRDGRAKKDGAAGASKGNKREPKPEAKASDLDADMDSYHAQRAAATAAAAGSSAAASAAAPTPAAAE